MANFRQSFNELLQGKDAFQISALTVGALLAAHGVVAVAESIRDGSCI
jgi:hypothetical protein